MINEEGIKKVVISQAEKLAQQAEEVNGMKYETSRKKKAEALRKELSKVETICGAIERATGKICTKVPVENAKRCLQHGGASTGAVTEEGKLVSYANLNPRANFVAGLYGRFVMTYEEREFYEVMMNHYIDTYDLDPANILMMDRAMRNFILNQRKEIADAGESIDESNSYNDYDMKFMRYMQALGLDRKFVVTEENKGDNSKNIGGGIAQLFMNDDE